MTNMMNMTRTTPMQHLKHTSTMHTMKTIDLRNRTLARRLLAGLAAGITLGGCAAPSPPPLTFAGTPTTTMTTKDPWRTSLDGEFDRSGWPSIRFETMASDACRRTARSRPLKRRCPSKPIEARSDGPPRRIRSSPPSIWSHHPSA